MSILSGVRPTACLNLYDNPILPTRLLIDMKVNKQHTITNINVTSGNSDYLINRKFIKAVYTFFFFFF